MCKLSIIIPLYNGKEYIKQNVEELLKINCSKEIIIVDDGSSDGSYSYCKKVFNDIFCIRLFKKENGGIASARNFGLEKSKGNYVIFVDQDDTVVSNVISKSVDIIESEKCDALFWSTEFKYDSGKCLKCDEVYKSLLVEKNEIQSEILPAMLYIQKSLYASYFGHVWAGIFSRKIIKENQIIFKYFINYEDDYLFVLDFLLKSQRIYMLRDVGYYWRINEKSYSHVTKSTPDYVTKSELFFKYIYEKYSEICTKEELEKLVVFGRQSTIIKAVRNVCAGETLDKSEISIIKKKMKSDEYRLALSDTLKITGDKRFSLLYSLLKRGLLIPSIIITRIYYIMR